MATGNKTLPPAHLIISIRWPAPTWGIDNAPPPKSRWSLYRLAKKFRGKSAVQDPPKRGRSKRTSPYIIPKLPADTSELSGVVLDSIRHQIATEKNKAASQKYRARRAQRESDKVKELGLLEQEKLRMELIESTKMSKIRSIKDFLNRKIQTKCDLCQNVLTTMITQTMPMVTIKLEMINLDSIKKELP